MTPTPMNDKEPLTAEDLRAAEELLLLLHQDREIHKTGNLLYDELFSYKNGLNRPYSEKARVAKNSCWIKIHEEIHGSGSSPTHNIRSNTFTLNYLKPYLKIAAILIVSILLSIFYLLSNDQQPVLIASSGSAMKTVELSDGSRVTLRPNASLYRLDTSESEHSVRLYGEAFFSVLNQPERTFSVETENGLIEVLGTQFNIRTWENSTTVYLDSGSLRLSSINGENQIILQPGQVSTVQPDFQISEPVATEKEYYTSWQENIIVFNDRMASALFQELEYHFSITIEASSHIENTLLGGAISLENLESALQNLGVVLDGEFVLIEEKRYRFNEHN